MRTRSNFMKVSARLTMNIDLKHLDEFKKAEHFEKICRKFFLPSLVLEIVLDAVVMIAIILSEVNINIVLLSLIIISFFAIPVATLISFISIQQVTYKKFVALEKELFNSKVLADDILKFGKENGIDLFSVALDARCLHELGLIGVPEWCARNSELPTKKDFINK